ncbi:MAG: UPF0149 family protein [Xanthomonadales bacterium]|jgi:uncharacterized protein YgfB (UPF0149 family)|nr:UPF0149 family protein [Xanthomonadales bacterium]
MAIESLPDFERSLALTQGNLDAAGLAETHGVACGLLVRQGDANLDAYLNLLSLLEIAPEPGPALRSIFEELLNATRDQLADEAFRLDLWLPEDEESLEDRTEALAQWCNGFLASMGAGDDPRIDTLSGEAAEALADIQEISMAELGGEEGAGEVSEEEETAYAEIVEYVRIAALILREELRGPRDGDSIH